MKARRLPPHEAFKFVFGKIRENDGLSDLMQDFFGGMLCEQLRIWDDLKYDLFYIDGEGNRVEREEFWFWKDGNIGPK